MKLKEIFNWIKKVAKPEKQIREIDKEDQFAMIKLKTKDLGFRHHKSHNNRKVTRGRRRQYVTIGKYSKPIFHSVV